MVAVLILTLQYTLKAVAVFSKIMHLCCQFSLISNTYFIAIYASKRSYLHQMALNRFLFSIFIFRFCIIVIYHSITPTIQLHAPVLR